MKLLISLILVLILVFIATLATQISGLNYLFGIIIPYLALITFVVGFIAKVFNWAKTPVPFNITTTCGQQKSLPWIKHDNLESPSDNKGLILRMFFEILFFRTLFRNTKMELRKGPQIVYGSNKWLWMAGMAFHYSFLVILIRHFKLFVEPAPFFISLVEGLDGFLQIGLPILMLTDVILLGAVGFLLLRRILDSKLRYISLPADYFPLMLILSIGITGVLMRYFTKVDVVGIKELAVGLFSFHPTVPAGINTLFFVHLFLVSVLIAYFPFSKLMHLGGVFLSPTRNMKNDNRVKRHINPWNPKVMVHTYEEWEDEFRGVMKDCGLPLEKEE